MTLPLQQLRDAVALMRELGAIRFRSGGFEVELGAEPAVQEDRLTLISPEEERRLKIQEARSRLEILYAASGAQFNEADVIAYAGIDV